MVEYQELNFDLDGDGIADALAIDIDGDGQPDVFWTDSNLDGELDQAFAMWDTDGDGIADTTLQIHDYNQDGVADSITMHSDFDQDGVVDVVSKIYDSDGDGVLDTAKTWQDWDGDGQADVVAEEQYLDTDNDGEIDTYIIQSDGDGDGVFEAVEIYEYDGQEPFVNLAPLNIHSEISGTYFDELQNFDPDSADPENVSGDPAQSMEEWEYQGETGRCALYSQKFVIEELTGQELDIEEMADLAESNGWFSEDSGTPLLNMNKMLDHYGVDSEMSFHNDIRDIQECLESGGKVIVAIDADEIWYGESDDLFSPAAAPDHAVQVIGIDHSDPDQPMVILNDSGTPNGCGEMVPLDTFLDAWEDGNCQMISCM